jgi:glutaconyl-CoA/methylmalonyl-CoA decarboxylase subunit gamma
MRYFVTLDPALESKSVIVDVQDPSTGAFLVLVDGRKVDVDIAMLGAQLSVLVDGRVVDLTIEGSPPDLGVILSGRRGRIRVESERQRAAEAARRPPPVASEWVTVSRMPGRVVRVLVHKGDSVLAGQPMVVMEAMKMEDEIRAKTAGTVADVHVLPGAAVEANAKLVTLA